MAREIRRALEDDWEIVREVSLRALLDTPDHFWATHADEPGSTWEIRASTDGAGSLVEVIGVRHLRGRGLLLYPFFVTGLAKSEVASHLRHFIERLESEFQTKSG